MQYHICINQLKNYSFSVISDLNTIIFKTLHFQYGRHLAFEGKTKVSQVHPADKYFGRSILPPKAPKASKQAQLQSLQ